MLLVACLRLHRERELAMTSPRSRSSRPCWHLRRARAGVPRSRQRQPAHLLRRAGGAHGALGVPIAFAFGLATFGYLALTTSTPLVVVVSRMDEGMSQPDPARGAALRLARRADRDDRHRRGDDRAFSPPCSATCAAASPYVLIGAMYLVSGISGSKAADMAAVAPGLFPEMKKRGAKRRRSRRAARSAPARRPRRSRRASC